MCPLFDVPRVILVTRVTAILQQNNLVNLANDCKLYLYGHRTIDFADNKNILLSTINFINETQRFIA